jgi:hypothetical protein
MGSTVANGEGPFSVLQSTNGLFINYISSWVGGGNTWLEQTQDVGGSRYWLWPSSGNQSTSGNHSYVWNASSFKGYRDNSSLGAGHLSTSSWPSANITMKTVSKPTGNSMITAVIVFPASLSLADADITSIYNLYKATIGQGLSLP